VGVTIRLRNNRLYLRATLPPKPGSTKTVQHQQDISLGIHANVQGVSLAEKQARLVGALLDCRQFTWEPYLKELERIPEQKTIGDWVREFELDYFKRRARTPASESTYGGYSRIFKRLPQDHPLSVELLQKVIEETPPNSRTRRKVCTALGMLARFAGLSFDTRSLVGSYTSASVKPRHIPTDAEIVHYFHQFHNPSWQWAYGVLATYGLRPHELFHLDLESYRGDELQVLGGKTGARLIFPFPRIWVDVFRLHDVKLPVVSARNNTEYGARVQDYFHKWTPLPFPAYCLRHAYAVRLIGFNVPIALAAKMLGHSVSIHTQTYHRWLDQNTLRTFFLSLTNV
jgi:integrase